MSYNKVKYKITNNDNNRFIWLSADDETEFPKGLYPAPKNWNESEKTLKRSTKTFGTYTELSKNLEFTKKAREFLLNALLFKDIEADLLLEEFRTNPNTEVWYLHSTGTFDFSAYDYNDTVFKVPFKSGGLNSLIQSQIKEKFELQRTEAINGNTITPIQTKDVVLEGRDIFLISELSCENEILAISSGNLIGEENYKNREPIPLKIISNSDSANVVQPFTINSQSIPSPTGNATTQEMFFLISDVNKENVSIDYSLTFTVGEDSYTLGDVDDKNLRIKINRFSNGNSFSNGETLAQIITIEDNVISKRGQTFTASGTLLVPSIAIDDSLAFVAEMEGSYAHETFPSDPFGQMYLQLDNVDSKLVIREDSSFDQTTTKAAIFHDTGEQLTKTITGEENRFYSEFYGITDLGYSQDGEFARTALTSGFYIRQFYDKNIEISLDDFLNTSNTIHNTGYGIETKNGVECLVLEDLKYFFQDTTAIVLDNQVSNVKRTPATDFYNSSLLFGYKKGGDYEEAMGLDEYNVQTGYVNPLTRVDTKYQKESDARADAYGREFARRKPKISFPEEDTRYDNDLHLLDLKKGLGTALEERKWQDDFFEEPIGIYSPETATNLRLTPRELNNRHQWFYGASLSKFQDDKVRFSNSSGNSELITIKLGEELQYENGDIDISDLEKPRFFPQWIEFDYKVNFSVNEQVYGTTNVNGREIPNYYFKVQFINERNEKEYGYLFELKPNKEGKWKLLKAI